MKSIQNNQDTITEGPAATSSGTAKLLFDVREAAARLSISVVSVRKLIRQKWLKRVPDFRKVLISDSELKRFLNRRSRGDETLTKVKTRWMGESRILIRDS